MICDKCKTNPATVFYTHVVNGDKVEKHLCESCAAEEAPVSLSTDWGVFNVLNSMLNGEVHSASQKPLRQRTTKCESCGTTWAEVQKHGYLGCGKCYQTFEKFIEEVLTRIHGTGIHSGKILKRRGTGIKLARSLDKLKHELQNAIHLEEFERAAELRDKIRAMEDSLKKEG